MPVVDPHPPAPRQPTLKRRGFLQLSAATALAAGLPASAQSSSPAAPVPPVAPARGRGRARNLIFMVSDGMSFGTLTLADMFRRQHEQRPSNWLNLFSRPAVRRGLYATHAADSLVTDSAASASAWGCGHRINNGVVNITADGTQRLPLTVHAVQAGKVAGCVTTTRITHATPASFFANSVRRDWELPIAQQLLDRNLHVALGGGERFFKPEMLGSRTDLSIVRDRAALLAPTDPAKRLLGLFADSHVPFVLDRTDSTPSLADMTRVALQRLSTHDDGFVLQVEGGRVDHAAHSNDAASLIREQLDFDDAIAEVLRFLGMHQPADSSSTRDDTLLIITSDHGNANPGLTLYGPDAQLGMDRLASVKHSFEWVVAQFSKLPAGERSAAAANALAQATGLELAPEDRRILDALFAGQRVAPFTELAKLEQVLGGLFANQCGVSFISGNHTADYVEVTALGPGSENLRPVGHHIDLHDLAVNALALGPGQLLEDMKDRATFPKPPKPD